MSPLDTSLKDSQDLDSISIQYHSGVSGFEIHYGLRRGRT